MNWFILIVAGLFEIGWAVGLKYTDGFTRPWPTALTVGAMVVSLGLLGVALKTLPVGTAYAVWVGVGAAGTAIAGILLFGEGFNAWKLVSLAMIVAGIVGLGRAATLAREELPAEGPRIQALRDRLEQKLFTIPGTRRNGEGPRVPNTTNLSFEGIEAESLLMALDLRALVHRALGAGQQAGHVHAGALQQRARAVFLAQHGHQQVFRLDVGVVVAQGEALRFGQRFLELGGEFV